MKQRAMIAMALLLHPKLVIADEPTTALDVVVQAEILEEIKDLQRSLGISVILITHDIATVGEACDHVSVMYGGQIIESGATDNVFRHPRHPYTLSLLSAYPPLHSRPDSLYKLRGTPPDLMNPPERCRFAERCFMAEDLCYEVDPDLTQLEGNRTSRCLFPQNVPAQLRGQL
jgi:oligopeptide/dipeptide ABC transporter ATP-binding protein